MEYKNIRSFIIRQPRVLKKISFLAQEGIWIIENFLGLEVRNESMKVIFQLKKRLFKQDQMKQLINLIQRNSQFKIMLGSREKNKYKSFYQEVLDKSTLVSNLSQLKIIDNIFQLMKAALAGRMLIRRQSTQVKDSQFEIKNNFLQRTEEPIIHLYLVFDVEVAQYQFEFLYRLFRPILKHWFHQLGAIMHVVGFGERSKESIVQQKINKLNETIPKQI